MSLGMCRQIAFRPDISKCLRDASRRPAPDTIHAEATESLQPDSQTAYVSYPGLLLHWISVATHTGGTTSCPTQCGTGLLPSVGPGPFDRRRKRWLSPCCASSRDGPSPRVLRRRQSRYGSRGDPTSHNVVHLQARI